MDSEEKLFDLSFKMNLYLIGICRECLSSVLFQLCHIRCTFVVCNKKTSKNLQVMRLKMSFHVYSYVCFFFPVVPLIA